MEKATGLAAPKNFAEADEVLALLRGIQDEMTRYRIDAFSEDLSVLITEVAVLPVWLGAAPSSAMRMTVRHEGAKEDT